MRLYTACGPNTLPCFGERGCGSAGTHWETAVEVLAERVDLLRGRQEERAILLPTLVHAVDGVKVGLAKQHGLGKVS